MADLMELDGHAEKIRQATLRFGQNFAEWLEAVAGELGVAKAKLSRQKSGAFAKWCKSELGWTIQHVRRLLSAAESLKAIKREPAGSLLPSSEKQLRPLNAIQDKSEVAKVWRQVVDHAESEGVEVTEKLVKQFVTPHRDLNPPDAPKPFDEERAGDALRAMLRKHLERWPADRIHIAKHWISEIVTKEFA